MPRSRLKPTDREKLEKLLEKKKSREDYINNYNDNHYFRLTCVYPIERKDAILEAMKQMETKSKSEYVSRLIDNDLRKRGLIN